MGSQPEARSTGPVVALSNKVQVNEEAGAFILKSLFCLIFVAKLKGN
jgi:hypothetical protein